MKILHRFTLKSYLGPLVMTFFIVMFILLMQFLWRYIDELVGKGLEWSVIAELMLFASANLVPMALPLATLLAALMTMGNLGENNELLAMKSAGISLPRILSPLIIITILISIGAFFFSNNILPYTNLKWTTLFYSINQQKPELTIKDGVFTTINDIYSIKIGEKNSKTSLMQRIMIYNHGKNEGNLEVTYADSGYIKVTNDEKYLVATLYSGNTYEERTESQNSGTLNRKYPSTKQQFKEQIINFQLNGQGLKRSDEDLFKSSAQAMNLYQLSKTKDSLESLSRSKEVAFHAFLANAILKNNCLKEKDSINKIKYYIPAGSILDTIADRDRQVIIETAISNARATKSHISSTSDELFSKRKNIAKHTMEWNRKFSLSFACIVFFLIGAPLGAIIRKGGSRCACGNLGSFLCDLLYDNHYR